MRILGIDPGTAIVGWAVLEKTNTGNAVIAYGDITTPKEDTLEQRLVDINKDLTELIEKYQPEHAAVEDLFFFKNQKTAMAVAHARGVILLTLAKKRVMVHSYTPLQVKQALTGYGRAEKKQIQEMIKNVLALEEVPQPDDVADALAVAYCHTHSISGVHK